MITNRQLFLTHLTDWFLFKNNALHIAPLPNITEQEIEMACAYIVEAIEQSVSQQAILEEVGY